MTEAAGRMRIGLLGGAFDPIHRGHLALARAALELENLDQVLFVVAAEPLHKRPEASATDRLAMVSAALEKEPGMASCDVEFGMQGPVYTVDAVQMLRRQLPNAEFVLILGGDAAVSFPFWYGSERLASMLRLACFPRGGEDLFPPLRDECGVGEATLFACYSVKLPAISSSQIRERLRAGEAASHLLPPAVAAFIRAKGLYQEHT